MIAVVVVEQHFERTPDGCLWTRANFSYPFWRRYLDVFDGVRVVARAREVASLSKPCQRVDGPGVSVAPIPDYLGPWQYLARARSVCRALENVVGPEDAVILRAPSQLANCLFPVMLRQSHPYGVEIVGDPWDVFAPGVVRHPLRPFFRRYFAKQLRAQCLHASAAAYVTQWTLQRRYPTSSGVLSTDYSSVQITNHTPGVLSVGISDGELIDGDATQVWSTDGQMGDATRLVMVGSLAQLYKGPDIALQALAICVREKLDICLTIVGDGKYRGQLERQAERLGLTDRVVFRGQLPQGNAVLAELDSADLFIMPSRTEGLPRAMIEAMACGLPCIGSAVGGIPELLPPEDLVPPGDAKALAGKIREVVTDVDRMTRMSLRNLGRTNDFRDDILQQRRRAFYGFLRRQTEEWLYGSPQQKRRA
jgi:glycosyltransferase involved in cell wall biosynthesis